MCSLSISALKKFSVVFLVLLSMSAYAQITLSAEIRPRFEFRNGFKKLRPEGDAFKPAAFVEQRTRIYLTYQKDKLKLHIAAQDIRMWGNHDQIYKTDSYNMFNIYEGYGEYQFDKNWAFKVGRQALDYDNSRFFGNLDWAQQGRSHDAFLFRFNNQNEWMADVGIALNNSGTEPKYLADALYMMSNYKNMQYAYVQRKLEKSAFSLIVQNDGRQSTLDSATANDVYYSQTLGVTGKGDLGKRLTLAGEFFYQMGASSGNINVSAYMYAIHLTLKTKITPIVLGLDNLSGSAQGSSEVNAFDPLYGTNHKFYGLMDYFYVGNAHGQQGRITGLVDVFLKTNFKLAEKHSLAAHFHIFQSPVAIYAGDLTTEMNKGLGSEIDLIYTLKVASDVKMQFGYSQMFATESMEAIKGFSGSKNATNNWGWIMIQIKPQLIGAKK